MTALGKILQGIINILYLVIGVFIVALLFVGTDVPLIQRIAVLIGGLVVMFLLKLLSGYIEKKAKQK